MLRHFDIGGKSRPFTFNMGALLEYEMRTGRLVIQDIQSCAHADTMSVRVMMDLMYSAFLAGCYEDGKEPDFDLRSVASWFGNIDQAMRFVQVLMQDLEESKDAGNAGAGPSKPKTAPQAQAK